MRSIIDDRALSKQEILKLLRGESIWEKTNAPVRPERVDLHLNAKKESA